MKNNIYLRQRLSLFIKTLAFAVIFTLLYTPSFALNTVQFFPQYYPNPTIGRPISSGSIYVGEPDLDPETVGNQKTLSVRQEDGTVVTVTQPISTNAGGVPEYSGSPVTLLVAGDYSLKILDSSGSQVYYMPSNVDVESIPISFDKAYDCDLPTALSDLGSVNQATLNVDCDCIIASGTTVTVTDNISLDVVNGGSFDGVSGGGTETLNINGPWIQGRYQTIGSNLTVSGTPKINFIYSEMWGENTTPGTTDMTAEIQAAETFAESASVPLSLSGDSYKIGSKISITDSVSIIGIPGKTIIDMSSITADTAFEILGSTTAVSEVLTSSTAEGDLTIDVADGSVFSADDWCQIRSSAVTGAGNIKKGEIVQILSISTNTITLKDPLNDVYATGDTATFDQLSMIEDVTFDGIKILGGDTITDDHVGIFAMFTKNLTVKNCFFQKTHDKGIRSLNNIGFRFLNNRFEDILDTGTGYGMSLTYACQDGVISGNIGKRMRHLVTHGGGGTYYGVPRRIIIDSNICYQSTEASFDAHSGAEDLTFSNNTSHGSAVDGIIVNCSRAKIIGNTVINAQRYGIFAQLTSAKPMEVMIHDNVIKNHDATSRGIFATVSNATYYDVESISIQDNTISNCSIGIDIYTSLAITIHGVSIIGNSIHGGTEDSIQMEKCVEFIIADNNFDYLTTKKGIELDACTDGIISSNVGLGAMADTATIGINLKSATNVSLSANLIHNSNKGIVMDNSCDYNILMGNITRTCTTPFTAGTGVNHIYETAASDPYNSF